MSGGTSVEIRRIDQFGNLAIKAVRCVRGELGHLAACPYNKEHFRIVAEADRFVLTHRIYAF